MVVGCGVCGRVLCVCRVCVVVCVCVVFGVVCVVVVGLYVFVVFVVFLLYPSVAQLVERLTVVYAYCVSVYLYSEINWSPVRFRSLGLLSCFFTQAHKLTSSTIARFSACFLAFLRPSLLPPSS